MNSLTPFGKVVVNILVITVMVAVMSIVGAIETAGV